MIYAPWVKDNAEIDYYFAFTLQAAVRITFLWLVSCMLQFHMYRPSRGETRLYLWPLHTSCYGIKY